MLGIEVDKIDGDDLKGKGGVKELNEKGQAQQMRMGQKEEIVVVATKIAKRGVRCLADRPAYNILACAHCPRIGLGHPKQTKFVLC